MTMSPRAPAGRRRLTSVSLTDWLLGGLGFSMATASASFAGYMIATAPAEVTGSGSKDFNIFVQWDKRAPQGGRHGPADHAPAAAPPAAVASEAPAAPVPALPAAASADAGIDTTPTGSIPAEANVTREARSPDRVGASGPLRDFRVRDVFGGHALIEHRSKFSLVQPGSILAGAGEVLAIERQGGAWIVRTAAGVIGGS